MTDFEIMQNINNQKDMSLDSIISKLPFLTYNDPLLFHIYASVNKLSDEETLQVQQTIETLKYNTAKLNESYLETCNITADFKE